MLRSVTLTGSQPIGNGEFDPEDLEDPQPMDPIISTDASELDHLPEGATVTEAPVESEWSTGDQIGENIDKYARVGQGLENLGVINTGLNWGMLISCVGTGAAIGGWIGAIIGLVVWGLIMLFGVNRPNEWSETGPGVHAWMATLGPQAFYDWLRDNAAQAMASVLGVQQAFVYWTIRNWGFVLDPLDPYYVANGIGVYNSTFFRTSQINWEPNGQDAPSEAVRDSIRSMPGIDEMPDWLPLLYSKIGIDYAFSLEFRRAGHTEAGFMILQKGFRIHMPTEFDTNAADDGASTFQPVPVGPRKGDTVTYTPTPKTPPTKSSEPNNLALIAGAALLGFFLLTNNQ